MAQNRLCARRGLAVRALACQIELRLHTSVRVSRDW